MDHFFEVVFYILPMCTHCNLLSTSSLLLEVAGGQEVEVGGKTGASLRENREEEGQVARVGNQGEEEGVEQGCIRRPGRRR